LCCAGLPCARCAAVATMLLPTELRERLAGLASALAGIACVYALAGLASSVSKAPKAPQVRPSAGIRMAAPRPTVAPPALASTTLPVQTVAAPKEKPRRQSVAVSPVEPTAPTPPQPSPPVVEVSTEVLAVQPRHADSGPERPMLAQPAEAPSMPPDDYRPAMQATDRPGENVLVLGLLVDSTGGVVEVQILVPSRHPLHDWGYAMAARQDRMVRLDPPLAPGDKRWLEVRIVYEDQNTRTLP
jgi:hypothetical protein